MQLLILSDKDFFCHQYYDKLFTELCEGSLVAENIESRNHRVIESFLLEET